MEIRKIAAIALKEFLLDTESLIAEESLTGGKFGMLRLVFREVFGRWPLTKKT